MKRNSTFDLQGLEFGDLQTNRFTFQGEGVQKGHSRMLWRLEQ